MHSVVIVVTELLVVASLLATAAFDFESSAREEFPEDWSTAVTREGGAPRRVIREGASSPAGSKALAQVSEDVASGRFPLAIRKTRASPTARSV
jgi:hypothetical protein